MEDVSITRCERERKKEKTPKAMRTQKRESEKRDERHKRERADSPYSIGVERQGA